MDGLQNATLPFAQEQLAKHGDFLPFGAVVTGDGEVKLLAAHAGEGASSSRDLLAMLVDGARNQASSNRAVALVADALVEGNQDAIRIDIEHRDGHAIALALPYKKRGLGRGIEFGEMIAAKGMRRIWT